MVNILIFGDSICWGAWDKQGGWVQRLREFIDEKNLSDEDFDCDVYNLGICGDAAEDILERFNFETEQRIEEGEENIIIFAVGLNDTQIINKKERFSFGEFKENLKKLIKLARRFSSKIIFVGLTNVDEEKVDPLPWSPTKSYKQERAEKFDNEIKTVCKEEKIYFIEIFKEFREDYKGLLEDGAHPNSKGHEKMYEVIKDFLIKNKII